MTSRLEHENRTATNGLSKMAQALADVWRQGERSLVRNTIECAMDCHTKRRWQDQVADMLGPDEGRQFNEFMRR